MAEHRLALAINGREQFSDLDRLRLSATNGDASFQLTSDSAALADSGRLMRSVTAPSGADWELAAIHVVHPGTEDYCAGNDWIASCPRRLDTTYRFNGAWFARDDLAPFGLMCLRMEWRAMTPQPPARKALT